VRAAFESIDAAGAGRGKCVAQHSGPPLNHVPPLLRALVAGSSNTSCACCHMPRLVPPIGSTVVSFFVSFLFTFFPPRYGSAFARVAGFPLYICGLPKVLNLANYLAYVPSLRVLRRRFSFGGLAISGCRYMHLCIPSDSTIQNLFLHVLCARPQADWLDLAAPTSGHSMLD
jgi:hypothetical protein